LSAGPQPDGEPEIAGRRWRDATAELDYAERHGAAPADVERLADEVIEARVAMFQAGVRGGWQLPEFLQTALDRDRRLLQIWPAEPDAEPDTEPGTEPGAGALSEAGSAVPPAETAG